MTRQRQRGAAAVEYTLVTLLVVAALFAPVGDTDASLVERLLDAFRGFQAHSIYLLSMP